MGKRVFGSIDSFVESSETDLKLGRLVANFGFLRALLRYAEFDEFHLFCPALDNLKLVQRRLEACVDDALLSRVVLSHHLNVPDALSRTDFSAFHLGDWYWYLPKMARLRARHASHPLPLTAPIHSLNGGDMFDKVAALTAAPLRPGDALFCTSTLGRGVVERHLDHALSSGAGNRPACRLLPLGVEEEYFVRRDRAACRQQLGLEAGAFHLLYVGRLSPATKADLVPLLYLLARLRLEAPRVDWRLLLAGGAAASDLDNLRQAAAELGLDGAVTVLGPVSDADKHALLAAADVFVSPVDNYQETFGISIIEAMAAGLPVVASDFDGYRDLVREGETGFRIPTLATQPPRVAGDMLEVLEDNLSSLLHAQGVALDMEAFGRRLLELAADPALRRRMGERARAVALAEYSWRAVIQGYDAAWRELKREADAAGLQPWTGTPRPDMRDIFRDYPTRHLEGGLALELTALAHAVLRGELPMPATYAEVALLSSGELLSHTLRTLLAGPQTVAAVRSQVQASLAVAADHVDYQLGWLLKYGLLRLLA
ncbi:glycosyltransferase family 4 protein [Chromobacterium subtsugae]|uniref:Glycosyltransferase family 4 protein n=1 Tax=Chromobacterium subtsugae TaxID=251747 RepID=A0ABS7FAF8_9NEIS|nr:MULTISPECIES: glycosyltransferase family 4 protein [Chromobacterium]KUM05662.1 hypothetical protein Cv017_07870 [Chromobacterium subtsugae]KZE87171.1 hypothetical protein AWB61_12545 [Chromobacterium sp. F49]MBW7565884.1 glycosyltransferase family 4 protein [Chromobacterium subtsugae]MBW8287076.1 glycosyltransferase family 4 protein [Chromobacterium subtsugae]OBU88159.1 hypothetical protein MY55_01080 [Chromobacterium subtsugae]